MDILHLIALFAAFVLGAWIRKPFVIRKKEEKKEAARSGAMQPDRMDIQMQNLLGYGMPDYRQKELSDDED